MDTDGESNRILHDKKGKHVAMFLCWFLGIGSLFPWNSMLTIEDYYGKLFPSYHPTRILTLVYSLFALGTLSLLAHNEAKLNTRLRIIGGFNIYFVSSFAIIILNAATSGKGGIGVFIGLCIISAAFAVAEAHTEGGMVGDLSLMHPELMQSYLAGLAAAGAITSALRLFTKAIFESSKDGLRKGAIMFFVISSLFELICVLLYTFVFPKLPIVKYYRLKAALEGSKTVCADLAAASVQHPNQEIEEESTQPSKHLNHSQLLLQNIDYVVGIYLVYVLTLSIFPDFLSEDIGSHDLGSWYGLLLIAVFNVSDLIGRYAPLTKQLKITSRKGLMVAIASRFLFIPAFYFTAKYGEQAGWIFMLTSVLGLTNGYITVLVLTEAPKGYEGPERNALGNLLAVCVCAGIFSGVVMDWLWLIGKGW